MAGDGELGGQAAAARFGMPAVHTALALQEQSGTFGNAKRRVLLLTCDDVRKRRICSSPPGKPHLYIRH